MSKKSLAIILAFFIVFSPVYSYAVLTALVAVAASSTGRVLVGNTIKRVGQAAISRAGMASMAAGLGYMASTKSAIEQDGWTIEYGGGGGGAGGSWDAPAGSGVDSQGNIDIAIYKIPDGTCFKYKDDSPFLPKNVSYPSISDLCKSLIGQDYGSNGRIASSKHVNGCSSHIVDKDSSNTIHSNLNLYVYQQTSCSSKQYITYNEFNTYLTKNLTNNQAGDIIKNIYNYDYSQHPNITINNNTTSGSDINNDLSISADPELNVTPRLRLDLETKKVNLDNVNDTNCTKTPEGAYDNCTGEPDPEEETDPNDPNNPTPEDPPPIECSANGFYQKICDWMDWTQETHDDPTDTNADVIDKSEDLSIDNDRIDFSNQCPAPTPIVTSVLGFPITDEINYQPLCDFFTMLNPFVVGMGGISSALIIAGGARRG